MAQRSTKGIFASSMVLAWVLFVGSVFAAFDLQVNSSANRTYVHTGNNVNYTITLTNAWPDPTGYFSLLEVIDADMVYQNNLGGSCIYTGSSTNLSGDQLSVYGLSLSASSSCTLTYTAQVSTGQNTRNWLLVPGKILNNYQVANTSWQTIAFDRTYNSTPVVIATPITNSQTNNYPIPVIRNVTKTGFQFAMCIDAGWKNCLAQNTWTVESFHYFVANKDLATQYAWVDVKTGVVTTAGANTALSFNKTFANIPIIWTSSQTYGETGGIAPVIWVDDTTVSQANFIGCVHRGTANSCASWRPSTTVWYVAFDLLNTVLPNFLSGFQNILNSTWTSIAFPAVIFDPHVMVTVNDDNGSNDPKYAWARVISGTWAQIRYCKQQWNNVCNTTHPSESTNWFMMNGLPKREVTNTTTTYYGGTDSNPANNSRSTALPHAYCGNGVVDLDETCDDANTNNSDACPNSCGVCIDNDSDWSCAGVDCDDTDANEYPWQTWYKDYDGDNYSDGTNTGGSVNVCNRPTDYYVASELTALTGDCDDTDAWINPTTIWYKDVDGDDFGDGTSQTQCTRPTNYYLSTELTATNTDCNDANATINPNTVWYKDVDGDDYSDGTSQTQCARPSNYYLSTEITATNGDCDDTDANEFPNQSWYKDIDGDDYSDTTLLTQCLRPSNYYIVGELISSSGDCDDTDANEYPWQTWYKDVDGDDYSDGVIQVQCVRSSNYYLSGELTANTWDCNDADALEKPGQTWYKDLDADRYGDNTNTSQCARPTDYYVQGELISSNGDCDDTDSSKNPAQAEVCDTIDNNCNTQIDEWDVCNQDFCTRDAINIPESECLALQAFYNNLNGAGWTADTNWLDNNDIETWLWIDLVTDGSGDTHVWTISLENNWLIWSLPSEIDDLPYLEELVLNDNTIVSLPGAIWSLPALEHFEIQNNNLVTLPSELGDAIALTTLMVDGNDLSVLPNALTQLGSLVLLSASNNQLTSLPATLGDLGSLESLLLENNQITTLPDSIADITTLEVLDMDYNELSTFPSIPNLTNLTLLSLAHNELTSLPSDIWSLSALQTLYVNNNQLTTLPDSIGTLSALDYLYAWSNLMSALPSTIGNATGVITVDLRDNALTSLPDSIGNWDALTTLYVQNNNLTTTPSTFGDMASLNTLYIHDNLLTSLPSAWSTLSALRFLYAYNNPQMVGTIPSSYSALTLFRLYIYNNALDRLVDPTYYAKIPASLTAWFASIPVKLYSNQWDISAPLVTGNQNLSLLYTGSFSYTYTVSENSFATNAAWSGMSIFFTGGALCSNLSTADKITNNSGISVITISVASTGLYNGCQLGVLDHAGNASNLITIDTFVYGTLLKEMCLHPDFTVPQAECEALVKLYEDTTGNNRRNKTNWLQNGDVETWFGVRTNLYAGTEHVDGLFLHKQSWIDEHGASSLWQGNRLVWSLPQELWNLTELRDLNFSTNSLTWSVPSSLWNATHMKKFYALRNTLWGEIPVTFGALTELEILHLSTNRIAWSLPSQIGQMTSLQALDLSENRLTGTLPASLWDLNNLWFLKLNNNYFSSTIPSEIGDATNLQYLYLGYNSLVGTLPSSFSQLTNLENLYIQTNYLDRLNTHNARIPASLSSWYAGISAKDLSNQWDITAPILTATWSINLLHTWSFNLPVEINENSYAVTTQWVGMSAIFSWSWLCLTLPASSLSQYTGLWTITVDPNEVGVYSGCVVRVTDHGSNISNWINMPTFTYSDADSLVCYDPTISIPVDECLALVSIYQASDGPTWTNRSNWLQATWVTTWYGVDTQSIDGQHHVTSIDLGNNNLSGTIAVSIGDLPYLMTLSLYQNNLRSTIPSSIWQLLQLQTCNLADNALDGVLPDQIASLTQLRVLNLSGNAFTGTLPLQMGNMTSMTGLIINDNSFQGDIPELIAQMTNLQMLNIANNEFVGPLPDDFVNLTALSTMRIQGNNIDRDANHDAVIPSALQSWYNALAVKAIYGQWDITKPILTSTGTIPQIVMGSIQFPVDIDENSYAINTSGTWMSISFAGSLNCATLSSPSKIEVSSWNVIVPIWATVEWAYMWCQLIVQDHWNNTWYLILPNFTYQIGCWDGTLQAWESCDEWRSCNDGRDCTDDYSICPTECQPRFVDNCNPECELSACGDGYIDTDGVDNRMWTRDDEACDEWSFCNNGSDCTNNPWACLSGSSECIPRLINGCTSLCQIPTCGDGVLDVNGPDNLTWTSDDEVCDDNNIIAGDGCSTNCKAETCGDGYRDFNGADNISGSNDDEACDMWLNNGQLGGLCTSACDNHATSCIPCWAECDGGTGKHSILLLIDTSSSMNGFSKFSATKTAAQAFIDLLPGASYDGSGVWISGTKVWLISVGDTANLLSAPTFSYSWVKTQINSLTLSAKTNLSAAINLATGYFSTGDTGATKHIIIISDGQPSLPDSSANALQLALQAATWAKSSGIVVHTIATQQHATWISMMRNMATSSAHAFKDESNGYITNLYEHIYGNIHCACMPTDEDCSICPNGCDESRCGDGYIDPNGIDNVSSTFDDEACDNGSYCNNGTDCTADATICANWLFECRPRSFNGCSASCTMWACGDGALDVNGGNNILWDGDDESCDDGNVVNGEWCNSACQREYCGDGYRDSNGPDNVVGNADDEECDLWQNNGVQWWLCSSTCTLPDDECVFCYETCDGGTGYHSIFMVLDVSTSMNEISPNGQPRYVNAKSGAISFLQLLAQNSAENTGFTTKVGLVTFCGTTQYFTWTTLNYTWLINYIASIDSNDLCNSTNFGDPINSVRQYYFANPVPVGYEKHIILLSDGEPTQWSGAYSPGEWAIYQAGQAESNGIDIYTISVDLTDIGVQYMSYISSSTKLNQAWVWPGFNKPVAQSSTYCASYNEWNFIGILFGDGTCNDLKWPDLAVNATLDGTEYSLTAAEGQPRWQINMNNIIDIEQINVYNRSTEMGETANYYVLVSNSPFATGATLSGLLTTPGVHAYYVNGTGERPSNIPIGLSGQYVRVQLTNVSPVSSSFTPKTYGPKVWLDGKDILNNSGATTFVDGATVTWWLDKSGSWNNAILSNITYEDGTTLDGLFVNQNNGAIRFSGSDIQTGMIIYVAKKEWSDRDGHMLRTMTSSSSYLIGASGKYARALKINTAPSFTSSSPAVTSLNPNPHVYSYYRNGNTYIFNDIGTQVSAWTTTQSTLGLVWGINTWSVTTDADIIISELLVYDKVLTTWQRQEIEAYLAYKRGLADALPTDHPYYQGKNLWLSEVEVIWCDATESECSDVYHYKDFWGIAIDTLYGHVFGNIHCDCLPEEVCGICGDGVKDTSKGEECDIGSYCDDRNGTTWTLCTGDPTICATQLGSGNDCRPRYTTSCTDTCKTPFCGDGVIWSMTHACITTNGITGNNCTDIYDCPGSESCTAILSWWVLIQRMCMTKEETITCHVWTGEYCDDHNASVWDGCTPACVFERCGDAYLDVDWPDDIFGTSDDEECDDGNNTTGDACNWSCRLEIKCWDGFVDTNGSDNITGNADDELCDEWSYCAGDPLVPCVSSAHCVTLWYPQNSCAPIFINDCSPTCDFGECGDGTLDIDWPDNVLITIWDNEDCDDGNLNVGDGCDGVCDLEFCGDGYADPDGPDNILWNSNDETCDDGNNLDDDGCSADCRVENPATCGDGYLNQVGEQCDDGNMVSNDGCSAICHFESPVRPPVQLATSCIEWRLPTIMNDELLPLWWTLNTVNSVDTTATTCDQVDAGKYIPGQSLLCRFTIYNGQNPINGVRTISNVPCLSSTRNGTNANIFQDIHIPQQFAPVIGNTYLNNISSWVGSWFGQYKIVLDQIQYTFCNRNNSWTVIPTPATVTQPICNMRATITNGFLLQKGVWLSTIENSDLSALNDADGTGLAAAGSFGEETFYAENADIGTLLWEVTDNLISKYLPSATLSTSLFNTSTTSIKKVPNEEIYVYDGVYPLTISDQLLASDVPFTLIVSASDLIIEGSLEGKWMYVVPNGTITFANEYCDENDMVRGIFIAGEGFLSSAARNDAISNDEWCNGGKLQIEWLLIGAWIDATFAQQRRAAIDLWDPAVDMFNNQWKTYGYNKYLTYVSAVTQAASNQWTTIDMTALRIAFENLNVQLIDTILMPIYPAVVLSQVDRDGMLAIKATHNQEQKQRRDVLFDGASVLIKTNPTLWQELPPGANDYREQINVTKYDN
jgi:cysteine-rich repeat protein